MKRDSGITTIKWALKASDGLAQVVQATTIVTEIYIDCSMDL